MKSYGFFIDKIKIDINTFLNNPKETWSSSANSIVNGLASDELRRLVPLETRREFGAFFTDSDLAQKFLQYLSPKFNSDSFIYDPACGAGNLLIATSNYLEEQGIKINWANQLMGTDIHPEFVEATKLRVLTNYLIKQTDKRIAELDVLNTFCSVKNNTGLQNNEFYEQATHIIVNPPFNLTISEDKLQWASGKVSAAALFIDKIIQYSNPGASIMALLPDVLRSGSRYEKWRKMVTNSCIIEKTKLLGQFDKHADVDVYAIRLTKRKKQAPTQKLPVKVANNETEVSTLSNMFEICVGPVVDNRDLHKGPKLPYIISKGLKGWCTEKETNKFRNHEGRPFECPFVVVKRTSRMSDKNRAVATIVSLPGKVYVDNHLIILKPKSGTMKDCKRALTLLKDHRTNDWLNEKIRCRHLTVKILANLPIWE